MKSLRNYVAMLFMGMLMTACYTNDIVEPVTNAGDNDSIQSIWDQLGVDTVTNYMHIDGTPADNLHPIAEADLHYLASPAVHLDYLEFKAGTPSDVLPREGEIVLLPANPDYAPLGALVMVESVTQGSPIKVNTHPVELQDAFKHLHIEMQLNEHGVAQLCGGIGYDREVPDDQEKPDWANSRASGGVDMSLGKDSKITVGTKVKMEKDRFSVTNTIGKSWSDGNGVKQEVKGSDQTAIGIKELYIKWDSDDQQVHDRVVEIVPYLEKSISVKYTVSGEDKAINTVKAHDWIPKFLKEIPLMVPIAPGVFITLPIHIETGMEAGPFGHLSVEAGLNYTVAVRARMCINEGGLYDSFIRQADNQGTSPFSFSNNITLSGGLYVQFPFKVSVGVLRTDLTSLGFKLAPRLELKTQLELKNMDLYKVNPRIKLDALLKGEIFGTVGVPLTPWQYKYFSIDPLAGLPPFNIFDWPVFPQVEKLMTSRTPDGTRGEITWMDGKDFFLRPQRSEMWVYAKDATEPFAKLSNDQAIELLDGWYSHTTVVGLNPDIDYYVVPTVTFLGLVYQGEPVLLGSTGEKLMSVGTTTFQYDQQGRMVTYTNGMAEEWASYIYDQAHGDFPAMIKLYDEVGNVTTMSNIEFNEQGCITSAHLTEDDGESGGLVCSYDKDGHILSLWNHYASDDFSRFNFTWINGNLEKTEITDEDGLSQRMVFEYESEQNKAQQWTYLTSANLGVFTFGGWAGLPPQRLPSKVKVTLWDLDNDEGEGRHIDNYVFNLKYKRDDADRIIKEQFTLIYTNNQGDRYEMEVEFPYVYGMPDSRAINRQLMRLPAPLRRALRFR